MKLGELIRKQGQRIRCNHRTSSSHWMVGCCLLAIRSSCQWNHRSSDHQIGCLKWISKVQICTISFTPMARKTINSSGCSRTFKCEAECMNLILVGRAFQNIAINMKTLPKKQKLSWLRIEELNSTPKSAWYQPGPDRKDQIVTHNLF
jgi:hypothetical protein